MNPLLAVLLFFAQDVAFDSIRLDAAKVDAIDAVDLNADDRPDLVVTAGRYARIHLFGAAGGFAKEPNQSIQFGADVFLWTAARFVDAPGLQLAVFSSRGIQRIPRMGPAAWGPPEDLIVAPNLFHGAAQPDAAPLRLEFLRDLDGDGFAEALYFVENSLWIFTQDKDGAGRARFRLKQKLPLPAEAEVKSGWGPHHRITQSLVIPLLVLGDVNEDKKTDLMYLRKESVGQFIQKSDGRFEIPKEAALSNEGDQKKARRRFVRFEAPPRVADFNGDGSLDIALPNYKFKARVELYFNRRGRPDFTSPDAVLNVEDAWSSGIYVEDIDGDGKPEIAQVVIPKFGVLGGIQTFLSGKIDVQLHFHRLEKGSFLNSPAQQISLSIPYTFTATTELAVPDLKFWPELKADVNGDGLKDLISGDEREVTVHFGSKAVLIEPAPSAKIKLNPPENTNATKTFVADFNGDGRSDLVFRYDPAGPGGSVIEIKLSKK